VLLTLADGPALLIVGLTIPAFDGGVFCIIHRSTK
jgi:hypothetical protein